MRTTIELPDHQRARLLELAAQRGEKGFSSLVQEALDAYFEQHQTRSEKIKKALAVRGALSDEEAEALEERTREIREHWR